MKMKFYISIIITFLTFNVFAQDAELKVSVSKNKLGVNQRLRVIFSFNKQGGDNFKVPNFKNFEIVGGPSQSINSYWINGKSSFNQSYTYIIQPKRKGEFNLPPASIQFNGKTLTSKPIKIIVTGAVKVPENPNDPNYIAKQNIHLVAVTSKSNPYFGEGIYVEYRLYFSENIGIYNYAVTEAPQYNGFWTQEIEIKERTVKTAMYNGERYRYAVLNKALLIPTKAGKLTINPMKMDIVVAVPTGRGDFFGNPITNQVKKSFQSAKKVIYSKELPTNGKPESFTGAVGNFNYTVDLDKNTLKANESSQIKLTIEGTGNLKLFELPKIETTKELETYKPERKERVSITSRGLQGSISEIYTVVPQYKGKYKISCNEFSYFNPKDKKYHTITPKNLYVDVLEGKELPKTNNSKIILENTADKTFRYIKTSSNFKSNKTSDFFKSYLYY
ncbi:MAG: protein BatD, partial [Tenacibaculum sp.]|nr:protein BatD [Tenacibaculum sp.]